MSPTRKKRKPAPRAKKTPVRAYTPDGLFTRDRLLATVQRIWSEQEQPAQATLQIDIMDQYMSVIRIAQGPRVWAKVASGPWQEPELQQLLADGMVQSAVRSRLGLECTPTAKLLATLPSS